MKKIKTKHYYFLFLLLFTLQAYGKEKAASFPPELLEIQKRYETSKGLLTEFEQTAFSALMKTEKKSSGVISILMPNQVRWEVQAPNPSIFISDGKKFLYYTPPFAPGGNGQLLVKKASDHQSKLMTALLTGSFKNSSDWSVKKVKDQEFEVLPKEGAAGDIQKAFLVINKSEKRIDSIRLTHRNGNRTEIRFKKFAFGKDKVNLSMFKFKAPPHTDIVEEKTLR